MSLERAIEPLQEYYKEKKASLMFHLDTVDDNHPILVEIANEIEEVRNQRNSAMQQSRELELIEYFDFVEHYNDSDSEIEEFIRQLDQEDMKRQSKRRGIAMFIRIKKKIK